MNNLKKSEVKFWLTIIGIIVSGVIAFTVLQMKVEAMYDKGTKLRKEFENSSDLLIEIKECQIRMEKDIEFIKKYVNKL